ncbi:MAG TPA: four helix bundle protein [Gemmatimonadaceae bacterium]|nr:four helix bundle protein [Gemmatimonadaceae bacterium]
MQDFRNLIAWQKAHALENRLDPFVDRFAKKRPIVADQVERCANSIPANISEGCGRATKKDFRRFLSDAIGSASELENHLIRAWRRGLITEEERDSLLADVVEVRKILHGLRKSLGE